MSDKKIILVGYSGHGLVLADTAFENGLNVIGYTDKIFKEFNPFGLKYLGDESSLDLNEWDLDFAFLLGVGDNVLREKIYNYMSENGKEIISLIHSSASISKFSSIGGGVFINKNVSINAFANIGKNVLLNTGCIIEHDCILGDSVHVGPSAVLAGGVKIGNRTFIGANSIIRQGVKIGEDVLVGAGSVILEDIPSGKKIVGNPGRYI